MSKALWLAVAGVSVALASQSARAALVIAGPISPINGHPEWFMDHTGRAVGLATAADPFFVGDPVDPTNPFSVAIGYGGEAFWWTADAEIATGGVEVRMVLAKEAAFFGDGAPMHGNQIAFGRVRVDFRTAPAGNYRVTDPWGREFLLNGMDDNDNSRYVDDNGDLYPYKNDARVLSLKLPDYVSYPGSENGDSLHLLSANVPTFLANSVAPVGYLGDGGTAGTLTNGGLFKLELLDAQGQATQTWQTDQFAVSGKIHDPGVIALPSGNLVVPNGLHALIIKPVGTTVTVTGGTLVAREIYATVELDGGIISPGGSPGTTTIIGDLIVSSNSVFDMEIDGFAGPGVNPGGHDFISVTGSVVLGGSTLNILANYPFTEADIGAEFNILRYGGTLFGTFGNDDNGLIRTIVGDHFLFFSVDYGTRSNDVISLTFTSVSAVPEPTALAWMLALCVPLLQRRRRSART